MLLFMNFVYYLRSYYGNYADNLPQSMLPDLQYEIPQIDSYYGEVDEILVDRPFGSSSLYVLFYLQFPPDELQKSIKRYGLSPIGFAEIEKFDKFVFVDDPQFEPSKKQARIICYRDGRKTCWTERNF